jgi:hypothetical protein
MFTQVKVHPAVRAHLAMHETRRAIRAGGVIAFYQLGYGIAAFGVGPLLDNGVKLSTVYGLTAVIAIVMGLASFGVTRAGRDNRELRDTAEPRSSGVERPA